MIVSEKTGRRRRSYSLRTRVAAAAALGATIIVAALSWVTVTAIERNNLAQADQQLRVASQLTMIEPVIAVTILGVLPQDNMAMTVRNADGSLASTKVQLPPLPVGNHTVTVNGDTYRVLTTTENQPAGRVVSLGISTTQTEAQTAAQRRWVMLAAAAAVAAAAGLGWLFGGRAVRPIVSLTRQVDQRDPAGDSGTPLPVDGSGVREAEKLAEAVNMMLERLDRAQAQTAAALETARDFAAVSAHELRTPLTAMRTDLEVMRTLQLDEAQRTEILEDLHRGQNRVESTLSALERLARGDLTSERDHVETDVAELCDAAAHDAMRHFPDLKVRLNVGSELVTRGLPTGLRLAVDNALTNSARHGRATEALLSAHRDPNGYIVISVDDNGVGIPPGERRAVFERFFRGSRASKGGSGLGLALVAQQAQLHGGRAYFDDGNLGGVRLVLVLPDRSAPATEPIDLRHA
ncbi:HAMP domain-containing sensor histidine kinase [Nocardia huaxiensis]|uniref:histidine kinase n=1 Tax=Nocardia huaxiensis TaxID=2755382 RepID=A0A7D6VBN7_9NOCA|nr:HAMP domain-containing sensor histidine kinase [Nocardia huaxiensis]QLY31674.1 HAMP domain-containing histidine kinase [Nocardia huaxiensis]UFS95228.1 HAMP domain-containing histidine kinase [Nocardia huaxiensis]